MDDEDAIALPKNDFRRERCYLAPWVFAWPGDGAAKTWPPPSDLIAQEHWGSIIDLPTDVALKSSSYEGTLIGRLDQLHSDWSSSWPEYGEAPFMEEAALLASEEFDALVFNALHGWYRQAIGCLRNALKTMIVTAALAVTGNQKSFVAWRAGSRRIRFGSARALLRDSLLGSQVDADAAPDSVFGNADTSWTKELYARLCAYAHSEGGYNNADFWQSNGPIFVPAALQTVEAEFRETLALSYLLLRLGWPSYQQGPGEPALLGGSQGDWTKFDGLLGKWLIPARP